MKPKLLKTEAEYEAALAQVEARLSARPGTARGDALDLWAHLVEVYEETHHPIPPPDPIAALRFRMEQQGLTPADLVPYLGSKSRVSEVLRGKRRLTLAMMRKLRAGLHLPAEVLLGEPPPSPPARVATRRPRAASSPRPSAAAR